LILYFFAIAADNFTKVSNASFVGLTFSKFHIKDIPTLGVLFRFACAHTTHSPPALPSYIFPKGSIIKLYQMSHRQLFMV